MFASLKQTWAEGQNFGSHVCQVMFSGKTNNQQLQHAGAEPPSDTVLKGGLQADKEPRYGQDIAASHIPRLEYRPRRSGTKLADDYTKST
jgi:hypothetical protein